MFNCLCIIFVTSSPLQRVLEFNQISHFDIHLVCGCNFGLTDKDLFQGMLKNY